MTKKPKAALAKKKSRAPAKKAKATKVALPEKAEHPVHTLRDEVDQLFENFERDFGMWPSRRRLFDIEPFFEPFRHLEPVAFGKQPTADLIETDEEFRVNAELPGMAEEDVEVTYSEGMLTIKGEKEEESEEKEEDYHVSERHYGKYRRSFSLPQTVDADKVEASMKDGVLTVVLPKLPEAKKEKKKVTIAKG